MATELNLEGFHLLMTDAEAKALCDQRGWEHNIAIGDTDASVAPGEPINLVRLKFEKSCVVSIEAEYQPPQPDRARSSASALPIQKKASILGKPYWAAFSIDRTLAVTGDVAGQAVTAMHLGVLASQREVDAVITTFGGGIAPPVRA